MSSELSEPSDEEMNIMNSSTILGEQETNWPVGSEKEILSGFTDQQLRDELDERKEYCKTNI